jgi:hypothetical protein
LERDEVRDSLVIRINLGLWQWFVKSKVVGMKVAYINKYKIKIIGV